MSGRLNQKAQPNPRTTARIFAGDTGYFGKGKQQHMLNYRVSNLKKVLAALKREGVWVDPKSGEKSDYGRFGWIKDGEGNRIELWEPPKA